MKKIAIIGGGAAGLFAAKMLTGYSDASVTIFEKAKDVAAKLRASGGGRANILNANIVPECYNNSQFMSLFLQKVDFQTIYHEFEKMGLAMRTDEENRVYPATFFSATVVDTLLNNLSKNVRIEREYEVRNLRSIKGKWQINDFPAQFDKVLILVGSPAGMTAKNQTGFADFLAPLHLSSRDFLPSLVGFEIKNYPRFLFGCRTKAEVSLSQNGKVVFQERGEVVFKEDGISGIVVMNASAYYNRLKNRSNCALLLNFLYDMDCNVVDYLKEFNNLSGLLHPKLVRLYEQNPFDPRALKLEIEGTYDLSSAQVASGGIDLAEIDEFFQLKRYPNLYVAGELLDIDGVCGGFNLFFAFASAYWIVKNIFREN